MTQPLTVKDILNDVDFELTQGMIASEGLRHSIEEIRRYQSQTRTQTFEKVGLNDPNRELLARQYQFNEMMLSIMHEMAVEIDALRQDLRQVRALPPGVLAGMEQTTAAVAGSAAGRAAMGASPEMATGSLSAALPADDEALRQAARQEAIQVDLATHAIRIPLIGWLLTRLRIIYHRPAHFYTYQLAVRQTLVNQTFSERIARLQNLLRMQQAQIENLATQVDDFQE